MKNLCVLIICLSGLAFTAAEAQNRVSGNSPDVTPVVVSCQIDLSRLTSLYARELFREKVAAYGCYMDVDLSEAVALVPVYLKEGLSNDGESDLKNIAEACLQEDINTPEKEKEAYLSRIFRGGKGEKVPCQNIKLYFDTANCVPQPVTEGAYMYFNLCSDDTVHFAVKGVYSQNGTNYTQNDALHKYYWVFGDGSNQTVFYEPYIDKHYPEVKGYEMVVTMTDTNNCPSNPLSARVRIAGNPIQSVSNPGRACFDPAHPNDTIQISLTSVASVVPFQYALISSQRYDSVTFIPDGMYCPEQCYNTPVTFTSFTPGQTITSASDILSVTVMMEHTYVGDLSLKLIGPNGDSTRLKIYTHSGGADMGIPNSSSLGDPCDARFNPPGIPWNYGWSEVYPNIGTINQNSSTSRLDSTDRTNNINYYLPDDSFATLIGCPLNGMWNLQVCDWWQADNGYVFSWQLNLDPALLPQNWQYTVGNDTTYLSGPGVVGQNKSNSLIVPSSPGTFNYNYVVEDNYGCVYDTTITLEVIASPDPSLGPDRHACVDESITIGSENCTDCAYDWSTGDKTPSINVHTTGEYWRKVTNTENCTATDTIQAFFHGPPVPVLIKHQ